MGSLFFVFTALHALRKSMPRRRTKTLLLAFLTIKLALVSATLYASENSVNDALWEAKKASQAFSITEAPTAAPIASARPADPIKSNRLEILYFERNALQKKLLSSEDDDYSSRLRGDLAAINREIDLVLSTESKFSRKTGKSQNEMPVNQTPESSGNKSSLHYESWDIFRNFGIKEN